MRMILSSKINSMNNNNVKENFLRIARTTTRSWLIRGILMKLRENAIIKHRLIHNKVIICNNANNENKPSQT